MRVTQETKSRTRERLLLSAQQLFERSGFEEATTRDITKSAGIALGTLFNYFANKESLALAIIAKALEEADREFHEQIRGNESLAELLFAHIAIGLRHLRPSRGYVVTVFESTLSPLAAKEVSQDSDDLRLRHLETVQGLIARYNNDAANAEPSFVSLHLYWTLYLGVLAYWSKDESTNQEDTLALLDQSVRLYVSTLLTNSFMPENNL